MMLRIFNFFTAFSNNLSFAFQFLKALVDIQYFKNFNIENESFNIQRNLVFA
jgi:hypothetical protein